ncbi:MAG: hypothetical protein HY821_12325 [Acidobacteria bacterium]|nr:hypothetical protein [Acidobacteriota bacterium]
MPVTATQMARRMRGGAQAHLLACDDGCHYVTKFLDNPQHRRILINEWAAKILLDHLQVAAPATRIVSLTPEFVASQPGVYLQLGHANKSVAPGWHFGSQFPGNPHSDAVYDFLPDSLLPSVANLAHFAGALVFDKWTANSDSRQAIFFRQRLRQWLDPSAPPQQKGFIAQMVDHGFIFDGPHWAFHDSPIQGLYFRPLVYRDLRSLDDFQPWLDRAIQCPESLGDQILRQIPTSWFDGDEPEFERLLAGLFSRRRRIEDLLLATIVSRPQSFPNFRILR